MDTVVRLVGRMTNSDFLPAEDSFRQRLLSAVITLLLYIYIYIYIYIYMFCLFSTLVPPIFCSSVSYFWSLTGHNILIWTCLYIDGMIYGIKVLFLGSIAEYNYLFFIIFVTHFWSLRNGHRCLGCLTQCYALFFKFHTRPDYQYLPCMYVYVCVYVYVCEWASKGRMMYQCIINILLNNIPLVLISEFFLHLD